MKRLLAVLAVLALIGSGAFALASAQEEKASRHAHSDGMGERMGGMMMGGMMSGRGMEEMQRFMQSERMPQAMTAMMEMARQKGDGDPMVGMVRMMEMMSMMGQMGGMMGPTQPSK